MIPYQATVEIYLEHIYPSDLRSLVRVAAKLWQCSTSDVHAYVLGVYRDNQGSLYTFGEWVEVEVSHPGRFWLQVRLEDDYIYVYPYYNNIRWLKLEKRLHCGKKYRCST